MSEQRPSNTVWWVIGIAAALILLLVLCLACALGGLLIIRTNAPSPQSLGPIPERAVTVPAIPRQEPGPGFRPDSGALVLRVDTGSPADGLGLEPGDIIIAVNGRDLGPNLTLRQALQSAEPGDTVSITWWVRTTRDVRTAPIELVADPDGTGNAYFGIEYRTLP
ncbi:MAG: PDZ domain-containing protein [Anaerolineae bacterium]